MTGPVPTAAPEAPPAPAPAPTLSPEQRWQALGEAYSRGILPPEKKAAYEEAKSRGLVPGAEKPAQEDKYGYAGHLADVAGEHIAKGFMNLAGTPSSLAQAAYNNLPNYLAGPLGNRGLISLPEVHVPGQGSDIQAAAKERGVIGAPEAAPRNEPEKLLGKTFEGVAMGGPGGPIGIALGAASGGLGEAGRYAYEGTPHEQQAEVIGNLLPALAQPVAGLARSAGRGLSGYKSWEPDYRAVGAALKGSMTDEGQATANLDQYLARQQQGLGAVPGHDLTTFQATGDPGLGALERQFSPLMADKLKAQQYSNSEAAQQVIQGKLPDAATVAAAVPATQARVQQTVGAMGPGVTTAEDAGSAVRSDLQARMGQAKAVQAGAGTKIEAEMGQQVPRQPLGALASEIEKASSGYALGNKTRDALNYMARAIRDTYVPDKAVPSNVLGPSGNPVMSVKPGKDASLQPLDSLQKTLYERTKLPYNDPNKIDFETYKETAPFRQKLMGILTDAAPEYGAARAEYKDVSQPVNKINADHVGQILARNNDYLGDYRLSDSAVAGKFLSRTDGPQATAQLLRAYDGNRPAALDAVGDHLVYLMKQKGAITPDNTVDLKAMAAFRKQNAPALDNFQALSGQSSSAMTFQHMAARAQARASLLEKFQNGPNSPLVTQDVNPATGNNVLSTTSLNKFLDKNANDITDLFGKGHLDDLRQIAKEISPTSWSNYTKAPGGGSDTAQKSMSVLQAVLSRQASKTAENMASGATAAVGSGIGALLGGPAGAAAGAGAGAFTGKVVAGKLASLAESRQKLTADLLQDLLINPARAKFVLEKYNSMNAPIQRNRIAEVIPYAMAVSHSNETSGSQ